MRLPEAGALLARAKLTTTPTSKSGERVSKVMAFNIFKKK